ncbi:hypothetical protein HBI38_104850 [Parastagonospora nodorum]|nr:hypothetical protein HBH50_146590 [Parastagonospora nodorum]KAH4089326.1 hypothetical protein HBH48_111690 [Parastagonospora nodorum]KAH4212397.1 hypothetical protein HBI95_036810 [Parastagonospora nodorum]KAH4610575.1 hypothetical protein HBH82_050580 [Parastagonospora nodorum]KAH4683398.1 hypothetical protein HBH78_126940 [Parastagonospora nodorum]
MDKSLFRDPVRQQMVFDARLTCKQERFGAKEIGDGHEVTTLTRQLTAECNNGVMVLWARFFYLEFFLLAGSSSMDEESRTVSAIGVDEFHHLRVPWAHLMGRVNLHA